MLTIEHLLLGDSEPRGGFGTWGGLSSYLSSIDGVESNFQLTHFTRYCYIKTTLPFGALFVVMDEAGVDSAIFTDLFFALERRALETPVKGAQSTPLLSLTLTPRERYGYKCCFPRLFIA